jgi:periplasmic protein TonB
VNYAERQRNPSRHLVGFGVVVVLHILLAWALMAGLARKIVEVVKEPLETKIIEEIKPPPPPPPENLPPPPKNLPPPPSFVPPPEVQVTPPPTPQPSITTTTVEPPPAPVTIAPAPTPEAPPAPAAPRIAARPAIANVQACAPKNEDYPAAAARAQATGTTKVRFTIDGQGKLVKAEVARSAGSSKEHRALDRVAIDKLSECTFTAGIDENGRPTGGVFEVDYVWKLE